MKPESSIFQAAAGQRDEARIPASGPLHKKITSTTRGRNRIWNVMIILCFACAIGSVAGLWFISVTQLTALHDKSSLAVQRFDTIPEFNLMGAILNYCSTDITRLVTFPEDYTAHIKSIRQDIKFMNNVLEGSDWRRSKGLIPEQVRAWRQFEAHWAIYQQKLTAWLNAVEEQQGLVDEQLTRQALDELFEESGILTHTLSHSNLFMLKSREIRQETLKKELQEGKAWLGNGVMVAGSVILVLGLCLLISASMFSQRKHFWAKVQFQMFRIPRKVMRSIRTRPKTWGVCILSFLLVLLLGINMLSRLEGKYITGSFGVLCGHPQYILVEKGEVMMHYPSCEPQGRLLGTYHFQKDGTVRLHFLNESGEIVSYGRIRVSSWGLTVYFDDDQENAPHYLPRYWIIQSIETLLSKLEILEFLEGT